MSKRPICRDCVYFDEHDVYHCHREPGGFCYTRPEATACKGYVALQEYLLDSRLRAVWRRKQVRETCLDDKVCADFIPTIIMGLDPKGQVE